MDREAERERNRQKNAARRERRSRSLHGAQGREMRRLKGGAFGTEAPGVFNVCAEGTTAIRRAEHDLEVE